MFSIKIKAVILCVLIFIIGFAGGYIGRNAIKTKENYAFQYRFERLEPLTQTLGLSDVQKALLFNILADNKNAIDNIMKEVNPQINIQLHIMRENIKAILDGQQKTIYTNLLKEHEIRRVNEQSE